MVSKLQWSLFALPFFTILARVVSQNANAGGTECVVAPYVSLLSEDIQTDQIDFVIREGRCFLDCHQHDTGATIRYENYTSWPFVAVRPSCAKHKFIHECTRGCSTWTSYSQAMTQSRDCPDDCYARCREECGGGNKCSNPDRLDPWMSRNDCQITCKLAQCSVGCNLGDTQESDSQSMIGIQVGSGDIHSIPPSPLAPPNLTQIPLVDEDDMSGMYSVNLENAAPSIDGVLAGMLLPVAFLFRVQDLSTNTTSYIWQNDITVPLQLTAYCCHNVSVSFAVINKRGRSNFSAPLLLHVNGDSRRIPNPPHNLSFTYQEDIRVGFFGHMTLNVTWMNPTDYRYLDNFTVSIKESTRNQNNHTISVSPSEDGVNSIVLYSELNSGLQLILTKSYLISITSVGADGNKTLGPQSILSTEQGFQSAISNFTCQKFWDGERYFSFILNWNIPPHWADTAVASEFHLVPSITSSIPFYSNIKVPMVNSQTFYSKTLNGQNNFFRPQHETEHYFQFELTVRWTRHNIFIPSIHTGYYCNTDAISPAPTPVRNFRVVSYDIIHTNRISIHYEWNPPITANGQLHEYSVCITPRPFELDEPEEGEREAQCTTTQNNTNSLNQTWNIYTEQHLYCQIRARNEFVFGNWTEALLLELAPTSPPPTSPPPTLPPTSPQTLPQTSAQPASQSSLSSVIIPLVAGIISLLVISVCAFCCVAICCRIRRRRKAFSRRTEAYSGNSLITVNPGIRRRPTVTTPTTTEPLLGQLVDEWEVSPSEVIVGDSLGEGAFGEVYRGSLKGPISCTKVQPSLRKAVFVDVAIKLLKSSAKGSERQDFLSEIEMMKKVSENHNPHVVGMLGCVTLQEPLCLVTEFVKYGDLLSYLRINRKMCTGSVSKGDNPYLKLGEISSVDLISFAYQIASGMEYLSSIGIVHRDLACRNILVDEGKVLKITDFGMSRETEEIYIQQSKGRVPFKWMAIESIIAREFTSASDVWSYGIILWEISTLGGVPYPGVQNEDLLPLLNRGYRMEKPDNCSPEIYDIMLSCWNGNPHQRPGFMELRSTFDCMLLEDRRGDYIEFSIDSTKPCHNEFEEANKILNISPGRHSHGSGHEDCMQLISSEEMFENVDCKKVVPSAICNGSPRFPPKRQSSRQQSPRQQSPRQQSPRQQSPRQQSPRQQSPRQQSPRQQSPHRYSPITSLSPSCQSPKKQQSAEGQSPRRWSLLQLLPGQRSLGSSSPQSHSPFHASNPLHLESTRDEEHHRPTSLFLARSREGRNREDATDLDRYVKEPTKLANLNLATENSRHSIGVAVTENSQLRRRSEGTLNMNSDGYVSFIGMDYSRDRRANQPLSSDIQITVTEDL